VVLTGGYCLRWGYILGMRGVLPRKRFILAVFVTRFEINITLFWIYG
jgi:hypothetical protein